MMLAGNEDASQTKYTLGTYGFSNGIVPEDMPALDDDGKSITLKKGTVVRVYVGKITQVDGPTLTVPNKDGYYMIEPAGGGYWLAYVATPETTTLMSSPAYQAKVPALRKRLVYAKLAPKDLLPLSKDGTADNAANDALNAQGVYDPAIYEMDPNGLPVLDKDGKPKRKAPSDNKNNPPPPKEDSNTGLLALLGVGVLAYFASQK